MGSTPRVERHTKKPVTIEDVEFTGEASARFIQGWAHPTVIEYVPQGYEHALRYEHEEDRSNGHTLDTAPEFLVIPTLEGNHRADLGDRVIRGVAGELYPCKPDIFAATYDQAESDSFDRLMDVLEDGRR